MLSNKMTRPMKPDDSITHQTLLLDSAGAAPSFAASS